MTIERKDVEKIAKLARISLNDHEKTMMEESLKSILGWIHQLDAVHTHDVPPLFSVNIDHMPTRDDQVDHTTTAQDILKNAPDQGFDMFAVPKVIE